MFSRDKVNVLGRHDVRNGCAIHNRKLRQRGVPRRWMEDPVTRSPWTCARSEYSDCHWKLSPRIPGKGYDAQIPLYPVRAFDFTNLISRDNLFALIWPQLFSIQALKCPIFMWYKHYDLNTAVNYFCIFIKKTVLLKIKNKTFPPQYFRSHQLRIPHIT